METEQIKRRRVPTSVIVCIVVVAILLSVLFTRTYYRNKYEKLLPVAEAMEIVENNYYFYDEETNNLTVSALRGIAANLGDDYSQYYTEEEYAELLQSNSGHYIGMGVTIMQRTVGEFYISAVFDNTPAAEAGIQVNDQILTINGVSCEGIGLTEFLSYFHGDDGSQNELELIRDGKKLNVTVVMREVYSPYVYHEMLDGEIGYILISGFQGECVEEMETALEDLQGRGMTKLVLDLRDNLGGSLNSVNAIAELLLPADSVITTVRSRTDDEYVYRTKDEGISVPIVVLVNNYSASASELLAGALRDNGVALLYGETTYGKGIVQTYYHLGGDDGYIKFTSEAYYTPNGVCIQGTGLEPDVEIVLDEAWSTTAISLIPHQEDNQLQAALRYLMELD